MKCPKCGFTPKQGRPRKISRSEVSTHLKYGKTLREIAKLMGVSHGAIALIRKELMKKSKIVLLLVLSLSFNGCALFKVVEYEWHSPGLTLLAQRGCGKSLNVRKPLAT